MKSSRVISALEPLIVFGLVAAFALVGFQSVNTLISRNVQPLASLPLVPEEPTPVALALEEPQTTTKR